MSEPHKDGDRKRTRTWPEFNSVFMLGSDLWNLIYDGILKLDKPRDTFLDDHADGSSNTHSRVEQ